MRLLGMHRWLPVLALVGCAHVHRVGHAELAVRAGASGPARFVGLVDDRPLTGRSGVDTTFAMVLPGGDWLAMTDGHLLRLSADGGALRWTADRVRVTQAVAAGDDAVIAVGSIVDPAALNGERRVMFRLDTARGRVAWEATSRVTSDGGSGALVRVGALTIAASGAGVVAVDDTGAIPWTDETRSETPLLVPTGNDVVIVRSPERTSDAFSAAAPLRQPLSVRVVDAATGAVRGTTELLPEGDYLAYAQAGVAGDGRIVLEAADVRAPAKDIIVDGAPSRDVTPVSTARLVVLDVHDPAHPTAAEQPVPPIVDVATVSPIAPGEVAFVDRYARAGELLAVRVVERDVKRIRRAPLLRPVRVRVGKGLDSFVQVIHVARAGARLELAGIFAGDLGALRGRVEEVDTCAARDHLECSEGHGTTTLAPFAGFLGVIE